MKNTRNEKENKYTIEGMAYERRGGGGGESWLLEVGASSPVYGESDDS